ncbi:MAG: hypothetical protein ACRD1Z_12100, partial [Vicinamibacteria bacterium]
MASKPVPVLCIYRVQQAKEKEFESLLEKHWPTLRDVGLVSETPARWYRGNARDGKRRFVEIFEWKDGEAAGVAHQSPRVMSIWEPMGALAD